MIFPIRVLVIDDSQFMRKALARRIELDSRFIVIDSAENGLEGFEKAKRIRPDVITLDVEMPVMNGIDALKLIVSQCSIPVVMVSSVTAAGAAITLEALEIGAVDVIPKSKGAERIHDTLFAAVSAKLRVRLTRPISQSTPVVDLRPRAKANELFNAKIVVVGSSTGGPQALGEVIRQLPASLPIPVVVAQHMPAQFTNALAKRLNDTCAIRVVEAKHGDDLQKGTVYIAPGGLQLRVTANGLAIAQNQGESLYSPSIDVLAQSAFAVFGKQILGVMLTGMGNDGTREFTKIKQAGGYNICQDQISCVVYGMPKSLAEAGGASEVLSLDRIGERIRVLLDC